MAKEKIQIEVNGQRVILEVEPDDLLVDVLRRDLKLTQGQRLVVERENVEPVLSSSMARLFHHV